MTHPAEVPAVLTEEQQRKRDAILSHFARRTKRELHKLAPHFALFRWLR